MKKGWRPPSRSGLFGRKNSESGSVAHHQKKSASAAITAYFIILVGVVAVVLFVLVLVLGVCLIWEAARARRRRVSANDLGHALVVLHEILEELLRLDPHPSSEECKGWSDSMQDLVLKVEKILTEHDGCSLKFCSTCYIPSKQAGELIEKATDLSREGKNLVIDAVWQKHTPNSVQHGLLLEHERLHVIQEDLNRLGDAHPYSERCMGWKNSLQELHHEAEKIVTRIEHDNFGDQPTKFIEIALAIGLVIEGKSLSFAARWQNHTFDFVTRVLKCKTEHLPINELPSTVHGKVLGFVERETDGVSSLLGISGMHGVGKTTLLRFVRDSYDHAFFSFFHHVFFVGAGTGCTVDTLQHVISANIGLAPSPHMSDIPNRISKSLKGTSFLLLLDDVRGSLDLAAVGLPMPLGHRQKVIFTTRCLPICSQMGCASSNIIQMKCLGEDDAWSLFKGKVGDEIIDAHPYIKCLAKKMAVECRGLPSALCTLGRAMSTKRDIKEWRYAYDVLLKSKRPQFDENQEMDDEGYSHLYRLEDTLQDTLF